MTSTTIDLHDLLTILLRERLLTEPRFVHSQLLEINDGSTPRKSVPAHIPLPALDNLPTYLPHVAYFLSDEDNQQQAPIEPKTFVHDDLKRESPTIPYPDLELLFWRIRHHDSGFLLAHALQLVLDALPASTTLRIRTSRGHTLLTSAHDFTIAEAPVTPSSITYICKLFKAPGMSSTQFGMAQYLTGAEGDIPWVYVLFGGSVAASRDPSQDGRVAVDLISPLIGLRGLGGEIFVMETLSTVVDKVLPNPWYPDELVLSGRIAPSPSRMQQANEATALSERVRERLEAIQNGGELFCAYCGKSAPSSQCSACQKVKYCNAECQSMGWKYHKRWCKEDQKE